MYKEMKVLREKDWSLNLEDSYYEEHPDEIMTESLDAVRETGPGCYVNIVTPEKCGDPREWLVAPLQARLEAIELPIRDIQYIDQCGCGGHVIRIFR